jgi:carbon monoxide dehydrogenase subunit G
MIVEAQVTIGASESAIWATITDIENAAEIISGIQKIEILEKPASGLVGLSWRETRLFFGKPATVEKRIRAATENKSYETKAEDGGFEFVTTFRIAKGNGGTTLTCSHDSRPQGLFPTLMSIPMRLFFKGVIKKAALQDLNDFKSAVERGRSIERPAQI